MSPVRKKDAPQLRLIRAPGEASPSDATPETKSAFDDSQLLASIRAGDRSKAAAFHDRVRPQIDKTLLRLFRRRDVDHEDLRQLALIELVTTIERFRGECSLDAWVGTLTARIVYKHLRRRQTERRIFTVADEGDHEPHSRVAVGGPRESMVRNLMQHAAVHLQALDPGRSWAFFLHDVLGYELREVAQIIGVSVAAAQSRLVRGRRELHERFASDPELSDLLETLGE